MKKILSYLHTAPGTSVNAPLSGEPTLPCAIGSQTQVPALTLTWKTSHFLSCSDSQEVFPLNHEENHPLKQDFEAATAIVFLLSIPRWVWRCRGSRGGGRVDREGERVTVSIPGHFLSMHREGCACFLQKDNQGGRSVAVDKHTTSQQVCGCLCVHSLCVSASSIAGGLCHGLSTYGDCRLNEHIHTATRQPVELLRRH